MLLIVVAEGALSLVQTPMRTNLLRISGIDTDESNWQIFSITSGGIRLLPDLERIGAGCDSLFCGVQLCKVRDDTKFRYAESE